MRETNDNLNLNSHERAEIVWPKSARESHLLDSNSNDNSQLIAITIHFQTIETFLCSRASCSKTYRAQNRLFDFYAFVCTSAAHARQLDHSRKQ